MVRDREAIALFFSLWFFFLPSPKVTSLPSAVWAIWSHLLDNSHPATKTALLLLWTRAFCVAGSGLCPDAFDLAGTL